MASANIARRAGVRLAALGLLALTSPAYASMRTAEAALDRPLYPRIETPPSGKYLTTGEYSFVLTSFEDVQEKCRASGDSREYRLGCALGKAPNPVVIVILEPSDRRIRRIFGEVVEHEIAHPQGYRHD